MCSQRTKAVVEADSATIRNSNNTGFHRKKTFIETCLTTPTSVLFSVFDLYSFHYFKAHKKQPLVIPWSNHGSASATLTVFSQLWT